MKTKVIFRAYRSNPGRGDVVAIFPEIPADRCGYEVTVYEHIGQHGGGDRQAMVAITRPATDAEAAPLLRELQRIGYTDLQICRKITPAMDRARMAEARKAPAPFPVTLIGEPDHKEKQAETISPLLRRNS